MTKTLKLKDILKMLPYSFAVKTNAIIGGIMLAVGVTIHICTKATNPMGLYFVCCAGMMLIQLWTSFNNFELFTSSPVRKQMMLKVPSLIVLLGLVFINIIFIVSNTVFWITYPEYQQQIFQSAVLAAVVEIILAIYMAIGYKKFYLSMIFVMVLAGGFGGISGRMFTSELESIQVIPIIAKIAPSGFAAMTAVELAGFVLAVVLHNVIAKLLYRLPIDPKSQGAYLKKYLKA